MLLKFKVNFRGEKGVTPSTFNYLANNFKTATMTIHILKFMLTVYFI